MPRCVPLRPFTILLTLGVLCSVPTARTLAQSCPSGTIQNLDVELTSCGTTNSYRITWNPIAAGIQYQVLRSTAFTDYCQVPSNTADISFTPIGTTTGTSFTNSELTSNRIFVYVVQVNGCPATRSVGRVVDTFTSPPSAPKLSAAPSGAGQVLLSFTQSDGRSSRIGPMERAGPNGTGNIPNFPTVFQNHCPLGSQKTFSDTGLGDGTYRYRLATRGNAANCYDLVYSSSASVTLTSCPTPQAPVLSIPHQTLPAGRSLAASWSAAEGLQDGGRYVVETSRNSFQTIDASAITTGLSAVLPTTPYPTDTVLGVRVRAIQPCGASSDSAIQVVTLISHASFLLRDNGPTWVVPVGGAAPTSSIRVKNIGTRTGRLLFSPSAPFFSATPGSLDLGPGQEGIVRLTPNADLLRSAGFHKGFLVASTDTGPLTTPVFLRVVPSTARTGAVVRAAVSSLLFKAAAGLDPPPQTITLNVSGGTGTTYLAPSIGPGGSWIDVSSEVGQGIASGDITITITIRRAQRGAQEGSRLFRSYLTIAPVGGDPFQDAAIIEIVDVETFTTQSATGVRGASSAAPSPLVPPPGGSSFILPTAVRAGGVQGELFTSDGWIRNFSGAPADIDLFCTADGRDGITSTAGNIFTRFTIPPNGLLRTSDLMLSVFGANGVSANIEARSASINLLSFRSTTDSVKGNDPASKFGTEIPVVSFGSGVGLGDPELVVPGADSDSLNRVNLILAETSGAPVKVKITVNATDGRLITSHERDLPSFSKIQINNTDLIPGTQLSGGWLGVSVVSGSGKVVPVATVIDNRSGSFSAIIGQQPRASVARRRAPLAGEDTYLIPTVARTVGQFNTQFLTNMSLVNGTGAAASLNLTYRYVDQDDGNIVKEVVKPLSLPARGSLAKALGNDMIRNFFGVTNRSFGSIYIGGDVTRVTGVASVAAQVDPNDASKGLKIAQVLGLFLDSQSVMDFGEQATRFSGIEQSDQKRTNLIMVEVDGQPADVAVRMYSQTGELLGEKTYSVGPNEYRQVNAVVSSDDGLAIGTGPFQNVEVSTQVVSGTGRVVSLASIIDNVSRNPEIFLLAPPAPPSDPTIGF